MAGRAGSASFGLRISTFFRHSEFDIIFSFFQFFRLHIILHQHQFLKLQFRQSISARDQVTHDHILLETLQWINLEGSGGIGQDSCCLLK